LSLEEVLDAGIRAKALSRGRHMKRMNAVVAVISGTIPAGTLGLRTLLGFVVYLLLVEEVHWRIHLAERPSGAGLCPQTPLHAS
jgi:hypothetical protein